MKFDVFPSLPTTAVAVWWRAGEWRWRRLS
jgi:hypothetical protein